MVNWYIKHEFTGMYWNQESLTWQEELTVICMGEYEDCRFWKTTNDLENCVIEMHL